MTNEVLNTMKTRRSCRCYLDKMPEPEALNAVLEAGTWAPTGMGRQIPVIVCIQNKADRDTLSKMNAAVMGGNGDPFYGAPCVAVVLVDKTIPTCVEDGSLVMGNMLNAAESVGLSACWIHRAKEMFETAEGQALLKKWGVPNAENLRSPRARPCCAAGACRSASWAWATASWVMLPRAAKRPLPRAKKTMWCL